MEGRPQSHDKEKGIKFNELSPQLMPILQYGDVHLIRRPEVGQGSQSKTAPAHIKAMLGPGWPILLPV